MSVQQTPTNGLTGKISTLDMSNLKGSSLTDKLAAEAAAKDSALGTDSIVGKPKDIVRPANIKEGDAIETAKVAQEIKELPLPTSNFW